MFRSKAAGSGGARVPRLSLGGRRDRGRGRAGRTGPVTGPPPSPLRFCSTPRHSTTPQGRWSPDPCPPPAPGVTIVPLQRAVTAVPALSQRIKPHPTGPGIEDHGTISTLPKEGDPTNLLLLPEGGNPTLLTRPRSQCHTRGSKSHPSDPSWKGVPAQGSPLEGGSTPPNPL